MFKLLKNAYYIYEVISVNFIDDEHEEFYNTKLNELKKIRKIDVYHRALLYTISICKETREHIEEIFDVKSDEANIDAIQRKWQTGTSKKVTRMAFNLWNGSLIYDSEDDLENRKISLEYAVSEIFCCSYAPFFWEAIKIRYPEYTK